MNRRAPLRTALAAALLAGCVTITNPVTGEREVTTMSPAREVSIGREAAQQVEQQIGLVRDAELAAYVSAIGARLAARSPRTDVEYRFQVADMPEPNAFALPGGWIYVSRGLLALANDEDELANVIGHEIGHVAARHAAQRETRALGVSILSVLGTIAAGLAGGAEAAQLASQVGQVAGAGLIASYGRDQERQADEIGQALAARAGWDPAGMADFLATLGQEEIVRTGAPRRPTFLDSHPAPAERATTARTRAGELARAGEFSIARGRAQFLRRIEGILIGPDPQEGVFEGQRFLHPGMDFALDFPSGWQTQNQKAAVAALSPRRDALVVLELQGPRGDPREAARRWLQANPVQVVDTASTRIGGFDAFRMLARASTQQGSTAAQLTWIDHPAGVLRLTAMTSPSRYSGYAPAFDAVAASFRRLAPEERAGIRALRLRIAQARAGETLDELGRRTGNRWSAKETALANGLEPGARLAAGQLVKVAVPEAP